MKKFLLTLATAMLAITAASGQTFREAPEKTHYSTPAANSLEWIQLCNYTTDIGGVGVSKGVQLEAGSMFGTDFLAEHKGKTISVVAIGLYSHLDEVTIEVRKGEDINTAETISSKVVGTLAGGWNYIKLDTPVEIDATEPLSIYYKATDTGDNPLGFDKNRNAPENTSFISMMGQPMYDMNEFGSLMIRALTGGDESELYNYATLDNVASQSLTEKGKPAEFLIRITNSTINEVESLSLAVETNGTTAERELTLDTPIGSNSSAVYTYTSDPVTEDSQFMFSITKVNGQDNNADIVKLGKDVGIYDIEQKVDRTILLEKFTGQTCPSCPGSEPYITSAIEGMEDRVARIDHHYGYYEDIFTITESAKIGKFFGVAAAPQCMMDRTYQPERSGTDVDGIVWHPGYMTKEIVENEIAKPAFVTVNISSTLDAATRQLTVTVEGKGNINMKNKRINVALTQSGYMGYQSGVGNNYEFNDFPIEYLTDYRGDAMTTDSEGNYSMTFRRTLKESYTNEQGSFETDLTRLKLIAFVTDWNTKTTSEVYNAAKADVKVPGRVSGTEADPVFYVTDRHIAVTGNCTSLAVYTIAGTQVENSGLSGLYIVKAVVDGRNFTRKIAVE